MFQSAMRGSGLKSFFQLMEQHSTQSEPAYCGITTLTISLNAMNVDPKQNWKGPWRWYEETMLNCCVSLEEIKKTGITIRVFNCLAICQGISTKVLYADDESVTVDTFRDAVRQACVDDENDNGNGNIFDGGEEREDQDNNNGDEGSHTQEPLRYVLVVSYNRKVLGQTGSGHFSPIAAYDEESDSVLIMDTARFKYGVHWVKLPLLFEAMTSLDPDSGRSRGFVLLENPEYKRGSVLLLPMSLLLRSQMRGKHVRQRYKEFLERQPHPVTWEDVYKYWTNNFTDSRHIWDMVDPAYIPTPREASAVCRLRDLIRDIKPDPPQHVPTGRSRCCGGKFLDTSSEEAIFVVYLASLDDEEQRRQLVMGHSNSSEHSDETMRQLLAEAHLIRYCIDTAEDAIAEEIENGVMATDDSCGCNTAEATSATSGSCCNSTKAGGDASAGFSNPDLISYDKPSTRP